MLIHAHLQTTQFRLQQGNSHYSSVLHIAVCIVNMLTWAKEAPPGNNNSIITHQWQSMSGKRVTIRQTHIQMGIKMCCYFSHLQLVTNWTNVLTACIIQTHQAAYNPITCIISIFQITAFSALTSMTGRPVKTVIRKGPLLGDSTKLEVTLEKDG